MAARTLTQYLLDVGSAARRTDYAHILSAVSVSVKLTAAAVSRGPLTLEPNRGKPRPTDREVNRGLRRLATSNLLAQTESIEQLAGISISGSAAIHQVSPTGRYLLLFEAMHGMSNLIDNLPVGSAFTILERTGTGPCTVEDFLQPGTQLDCAGIALYGPRTVMVVTVGEGVDGFTLDRDVGNFVLTRPQLKVPSDAHVFAVNPTEAPHWPSPVKRYVGECVLGVDGPRGHDFTMRWNASALVGAYRVLNSGGLFLVPEIDKPSGWLAPLLYTAAPLAFLAEQAGGGATTGTRRVLEVVPTSLATRVPFFFGSAEEVARITSYFNEPDQGDDKAYSHPLFHHRTLFSD